MQLSHSAEDLAFQGEVRAFLADNLPAELAEAVRLGSAADRELLRSWYRTLEEQGWAAPGWPAEHGGTGWSLMRRHIFDVESRLAHAPAANGANINMVGPAIIQYGSDAVRERFLAPTRSGEIQWTQGYSEPGAGSDLARVATRAVPDGDTYRVTGRKIWTSGAEHADWIFVLVRTDPEAKPQRGISFLLIDMATPGVSVEPLYAFNGKRLWNQVVFDDVVVPKDQRLGEENRGWTVAKTLLGDERADAVRVSENLRILSNLDRVLAGEPLEHSDRADLLARREALEIRLKALEMTSLRMLSAADAGTVMGAEPSMLKLKGSELIQEFDILICEALGHHTLRADRTATTGRNGREPIGPAYAEYAASGRFHHRGYTIAGGTSEIQHNIIAQAVLGL